MKSYSLDAKIGVIDTNAVIEKSLAYVEASKILEGKMSNLQDAAINSGQYLSNKFEILENKKNMLSISEYNYQKNILITEEDNLQKKFYNQRIELDKQFNNMNKILEFFLKDIIYEISKSQNIIIVFNKSITLFNKESIDITKLIIERLNKKLKFIDVKL
jgi:Skp family chaperone for outer membrane proteins